MDKEDLKLAKEFAGSFISKDKPELILITGSKVFGVKSTDFDMCVVAKYPEKFIRRYSHFVAVEKYPKYYHDEEFEIQLADWKHIEEWLKKFSTFYAWHFQNAYVLYDKGKRFAKLKKKYGMTDAKRKKLIFEYFEDAYDNINNARKTEKRKCRLHMAEAFNLILKIWYLINNKFIPPIKWRIYLLRTLRKRPSVNEDFARNISIEKLSRLLKLTQKTLLKQRLMSKKDFSAIHGE
jgi:hypothetical protein